MHKDAIYIYGIAKGKKWPLTMKAVTMAHIWHKGQLRDDGAPYIDHPLMVCRTLLNLNNSLIVTDAVSAAGLLHDTVEDKRTTLEIVREIFGKEVADLVDLLTRRENESEENYLRRVATHPGAILIKGADRFRNIGTMVQLIDKKGNIERLIRYIADTKEHILPMLKEGRRMHLEYSDAYVLFRDDIKTVIDVAEPYIEKFKENQRLKEELDALKKSGSIA